MRTQHARQSHIKYINTFVCTLYQRLQCDYTATDKYTTGTSGTIFVECSEQLAQKSTRSKEISKMKKYVDCVRQSEMKANCKFQITHDMRTE